MDLTAPLTAGQPIRYFPDMKRRTFLLAGLGTGGALVLGWALLPPRQRLIGRAKPGPADGTIRLNGWVEIAPDDTVTVVVPKAEMGQGIHTALAMLLAEELGCAWERVRVTPSPIDQIYANVSVLREGMPLRDDETNAVARATRWLAAKTGREFGLMMTGGSSSLRDCWGPLREAGASARASLVAAAAARLGVEPTDCQVHDGVISHGARRVRFGEVAAEAVEHRPSQVTLKAMSTFTLLGRSTPRLDSAEKSRGAPLYACDVRLPGMLYAAVAMCPTLGGTPRRFDEQAARARPGVKAVVALSGSGYGDPAGVAVVADSWWHARQGVAALAVEWDTGTQQTIATSEILPRLHAAAAGDGGAPMRWHGDADEALAASARVMEATYEAPYLAHATMEPMNATVRVDADGAALWVGTQVPGVARAAVAKVTGLSADSITVHQLLLGGGFGRRLDADYVAQAAAIAKALPGVPVQLQWTREDDMRHDFYRPATVSRLRAGLDAGGRITSFLAHSAGDPPFKMYSRRIGFLMTSAGPDRTTAEGTWDQPYEFPAWHSRHTEVQGRVPVGSWRSVGHSHQAFFVESFVDEIAASTKTDAAALRQSLLTQHPRARAVLDLVMAKSGWGTPIGHAPDGQPMARGIALHASFGATVAEVAEVSVATSGAIRVHRVVAAVDCGFVVNPNTVVQQVESAIIYGLSAALYGEITVAQGVVQQANFDGYRPLRIAECPVIETHLVPSLEEPSGIGEPALPPIAPAVANAVFALTGTRLRTLPLRLPPVASTGLPAGGTP